MKRFYLFVFLATINFSLLAQSAKYSNDFLNIGIGARWLAMGNTGVAASTDVESAYWNPAGLTSIKSSYELGGMHASYFAGMASYNYLGIAHKLDTASAIAFSIIRFGVDDIPNTTDLVDSDGNWSYDRLKMFSVADYAFLLSYARNLPIEGLTVGGNAKIIYRNIGKFANAWGFGFDVAARYKMGSWVFGANFRDITTTVNVWSFNPDELEITIGDSTFNRAPENSLEISLPQLTLGVARIFSLTQDLRLLAEFNSVLYFDGQRNTPISTSFASIEPRMGVELGYLNLLFIRLGINNLQKVREFDNKQSIILQPNLGLGVKLKGISIDYALTNVGNVGFSRYSNIFSLKWEFNRISFPKVSKK
jgi:hypothetical protein